MITTDQPQESNPNETPSTVYWNPDEQVIIENPFNKQS
jgi:hypothetical protein